MTSTIEGETLLRTDARGRVRTPVERREALLDEFERSGLSAAKFAELMGVKYQTFASWRQRRLRQQKAGVAVEPDRPAGGLRWLEAVVEDRMESPRRETGLKVELPGGARLVIEDRPQAMLAAQLLAALGGQGC